MKCFAQISRSRCRSSVITTVPITDPKCILPHQKTFTLSPLGPCKYVVALAREVCWSLTIALHCKSPDHLALLRGVRLLPSADFIDHSHWLELS